MANRRHGGAHGTARSLSLAPSLTHSLTGSTGSTGSLGRPLTEQSPVGWCWRCSPVPLSLSLSLPFSPDAPFRVQTTGTHDRHTHIHTAQSTADTRAQCRRNGRLGVTIEAGDK